MDKNLVALTPPMGWNSWDCYGASVTEAILLENAQYMADNLKDFGWQYVVCDIQWSEPTAKSCDYNAFADLCMDEYSRLIPATNRFPSSSDGQGFAPIAKKVHDMGLLFGIHIMRGIPRQAVHRNTAILGTNVRARDIAHPWSLCAWNSDMYGINPDAPGAQQYYDSLFELYADWGVDYIKVDDICNTGRAHSDPYFGAREIEIIHKSIKRCKRPMVLSLSPGPAVVEHASHLSKYANMWRITDDLWDQWHLVKAMFERCDVWQTHVRPGCWPDCDMLPLGVLCCFRNGGEPCRLTKDEQRTLMTLWCIFRSPLMMGGDMRRMDEWTLSLLTNRELLHLTNHSEGAYQITRNDNEAIWATRDTKGAAYVALFNLSDEERNVEASLKDLGFDSEVSLYDLWLHEESGYAKNILGTKLNPHASIIYKIG